MNVVQGRAGSGLASFLEEGAFFVKWRGRKVCLAKKNAVCRLNGFAWSPTSNPAAG